jgi:hypothetical protein
MCMEEAQYGEEYRPVERTYRPQAPGPKDGIPEGQCAACGFPGPHAGARECIDVLRDRIAVLEFKGAGRRPPGRAERDRWCSGEAAEEKHCIKVL